MPRSRAFRFCVLLCVTTILIAGCSKGQTYSGPYLGQTPPGTTPEPFLSSVFGEVHSVCEFSPDGSEVYWSNMDGKMRYMKLKNGVWTRPASPSFATGYSSDSPAFSPDGSRLFFTQGEYDAATGGSRERMYYVERAKGGWSDPVLMPDTVNSIRLHWHMSFASDGDLYYADSYDIYCSKYENGQYLLPSPITEVNTEQRDGQPFLARDGSYLLFVRADGTTASIWASFKKADGSWGEPVRFESPINEKLEITPWVSYDGKYLFFASRRSGTQQIYWVDAGVIEALRPQ